MLLATCLLSLPALLLAPQGGNLKLPPQRQQPKVRVRRPLTELERFRRDVAELSSSATRLDAELQRIGLRYPRIEELMIEVLRTARAREMTDLMPVARRFGTPRVAEELRFQLLARPLGSATRAAIAAMVSLMGDERDPRGDLDEKAALRDLIRARLASVRRPATEAMAAIATVEDLPFAIELSGEQALGLRLRGVDLLRAIGDEAAQARLIELLSKESSLAGAACRALIQIGPGAADALLEVLAGPPIDRGYCYAAFALAEIGDRQGECRLLAEHAVKLDPQLRSRESLTRSLAAIAMADLTYSGRVEGERADDALIVEALLDLVDGRRFVPNLDLLRSPAERRLQRMTGRVATSPDAMSWREWWQLRRAGFVGIRAAVAVDEGNVGSAVVTLRTDRRIVRALGEDMAGVQPLSDALEIVLRKDRMLKLVRDLESLGFGDARAMRCDDSLPIARTLELEVGGGRALVGVPASSHVAFDGLVGRLEAEVDRELWQLYRNPRDEPDRAAFWRAEMRWLDAHPDPTERGRRFGRRVFRNWNAISGWLRGRALEYLFARPDRDRLFDETDGERILAVVRASDELGELELSLLELAASVPGDRVWRECVDLASRHPGGGRRAVRSVFAVLGPDAVLTALEDDRPEVRRAAIGEVVVARDLRAGPRLVELLADERQPVDVREAAAGAAGNLKLVEASEPLITVIIADETPPGLRRRCLVALGRCGGDRAFAVLDRALHAPVPEDREAALRGLGALRDPRAAHTLAEMAVIAHGKPLGNLARFHLGRMGAQLAVPALRQQAKIVRDPAIRTELVLLLGVYQDPRNVPDLMDLLRVPERASAAASLLMGTTGVDLSEAGDRWLVMDDWWRANRDRPQWRWFLDALAAAGEPTVLRPEAFAPGAGIQALPELARLLGDLDEPRLFVLCSAVLRTVAHEDLGIVTMSTPKKERVGIAGRYRLLVEARKAARGGR